VSLWEAARDKIRPHRRQTNVSRERRGRGEWLGVFRGTRSGDFESRSGREARNKRMERKK